MTTLKELAFTFLDAEVLPAHLRGFWVAKTQAIILSVFLSPEEMEMSVEIVQQLVSDKKTGVQRLLKGDHGA